MNEERIEYRGWTIVKLSFIRVNPDKSEKPFESYVILSKAYIGRPEAECFLPLHCYDKFMNYQDFYTLDQAKKYIDEYLVDSMNMMEIVILNRDEVSNVPKRPGRPI